MHLDWGPVDKYAMFCSVYLHRMYARGLHCTALVVVVVVVYWQKCGQRNRDTTRIAVKN